MKLIKKALLFTSMIPMLLSCGNSSIAGTYYFQLGKEQGTHFGVYLHLTDEAYIPDDNENLGGESFKKFDLDIHVHFPEADDSVAEETIDNILGYFPNGIPGYYRLTDEKNQHGEQRIKVGIDFHDVYGTIAEMYKEQTGEDIPFTEEDLQELNDTQVVQSLLYTTYKDSTVNMYIPVSGDDVYYQLYWYGKDIKIDLQNISFDVVDVEAHPIGTQPTQ